jgi:hypothetical protein
MLALTVRTYAPVVHDQYAMATSIRYTLNVASHIAQGFPTEALLFNVITGVLSVYLSTRVIPAFANTPSTRCMPVPPVSSTSVHREREREIEARTSNGNKDTDNFLVT